MSDTSEQPTGSRKRNPFSAWKRSKKTSADYHPSGGTLAPTMHTNTGGVGHHSGSMDPAQTFGCYPSSGGADLQKFADRRHYNSDIPRASHHEDFSYNVNPAQPVDPKRVSHSSDLMDPPQSFGHYSPSSNSAGPQQSADHGHYSSDIPRASHHGHSSYNANPAQSVDPYRGDFSRSVINQNPDNYDTSRRHRNSSEPLRSAGQHSSNVVETGPSNNAEDVSNIVIFGETGVGKSSLINMITGRETAATSSGARGCTFESVPHDVELEGRKYRLWDTIGLNEAEKGTVPADRAIEMLQELVYNLKGGGVNLLVYCIRGLRYRNIVKINYDLFSNVICEGKVPIVAVVTGLENEDDMGAWWEDNLVDFDKRQMTFTDHACITTTKGKIMKDGQYMYEEEYRESTELVKKLLVRCCPPKAWKPNGSRWLSNIVESMGQMSGQRGYQGYQHSTSSRTFVDEEENRGHPLTGMLVGLATTFLLHILRLV
ncbi:hypothetical protein AX15_001924 [Amanita polypyramis BW_CC]|nr:hypothetical protein AX15_001924 [Amanita polypyramis BW_CC]